MFNTYKCKYNELVETITSDLNSYEMRIRELMFAKEPNLFEISKYKMLTAYLKCLLEKLND